MPLPGGPRPGRRAAGPHPERAAGRWRDRRPDRAAHAGLLPRRLAARAPPVPGLLRPPRPRTSSAPATSRSCTWSPCGAGCTSATRRSPGACTTPSWRRRSGPTASSRRASTWRRACRSRSPTPRTRARSLDTDPFAYGVAATRHTVAPCAVRPRAGHGRTGARRRGDLRARAAGHVGRARNAQWCRELPRIGARGRAGARRRPRAAGRRRAATRRCILAMPRLDRLPEAQAKGLLSHDCLGHDDAPWTPLRQPLGAARLALVTTAGLHVRGDAPLRPATRATARSRPPRRRATSSRATPASASTARGCSRTSTSPSRSTGRATWSGRASWAAWRRTTTRFSAPSAATTASSRTRPGGRPPAPRRRRGLVLLTGT